MRSEVLGHNGGDYEQYCLLGRGCVVSWIFTDVLEGRPASIFWIRISRNQASLRIYCFLASVYSLNLKIEAVDSSESSANFYRNTRRHILDDILPKALICLSR